MSGSNNSLALVSGGSIPPSSRSLWASINKGLELNPEGPAVISTHQTSTHLASIIDKSNTNDGDCLSWTYIDMKKGAFYLMTAFKIRGVHRGSTLVTFLPNGIEWALLFWVASMLQLTMVPLDPEIVTPGREDQLRYFLDMLEPSIVVVTGYQETKTFDKFAGLQNNTIKVLGRTADQPATDAWLSLEDLATEGKDFGEAVNVTQDEGLEADGNRLSVILFTSGTSSGCSKGCPHTSLSLCSSVESRTTYLNLKPLPCMVVHTVNFRAISVFTSLAAWRHGGCIVLAGEKFDPDTTLEVAEKYRCSWMPGVPIMVPALASRPGIDTRDLSSISFFGLGGDIVTEQLIDAAQRLLPKARVRPFFGMTEGIGIIGWSQDDQPDYIPTFLSIAASGKVLPGAMVKICSATRQVLARGQIGELHLSAPSLIKRYFQGEQPELFYTESDGRDWVFTGDQGVIDNEGFVYVLGRSKDVIKRNAVPLSPAMIEVFLQSKLDIVAQAFGISAPDVGAEPYAVVADSGSHDLTTLPDLVASGLGHDYRLKGVATLTQLGFEDWPKNASGKIVKLELREAMIEYLNKND